MPLIAWIAGGFALNMLLGACVLAFVDHDGRLLEWAKREPSGGWLGWLILTLWPVVVWAYYRKGKEQEP